MGRAGVNGDAVLAFEEVAYVTGGIRLFDGLSFSLGPAERLAILGGSGDGKSMIARLAIGLARPLSGAVRLFGADLDTLGQEELRARRARCGLTVQGGSLLGSLSVEDNLWLSLGAVAGARARLRRKLDRILLEFQLEHVVGVVADALSAGERRRVELARAFLRDPDLVILDEPLDGARAYADRLEAQIRRQTVSRGRALLLLTQDADLAGRLCDRVLRLDRNRLVQQAGAGAEPVAIS